MKTSIKIITCLLALVSLNATAQTVLDTITFAWNASTSPGIKKYFLYFSQSTNEWTHVKDAGLELQATVGLPALGKWYFIATALNTNGIESLPSNMLSFDVLPEPNGPSGLKILSVVSTRIETVVKAPNIITAP